MGLLSFLSVDCMTNLHNEDTKRQSVSLFNSAHNSIKIVAGRLDNDFYSDQGTIDALNAATNRGVSVNIAYVPSTHNNRYVEHFIQRVPKVRMIATKRIPDRHWVSVDSKHLRIEHTHSEDAKITPAFICKNASKLAKEWDLKFNSLI